MKKVFFVGYILFFIIISYLLIDPYKEHTINKNLSGIIFTLDGEIIKKVSVDISGTVKQYKLGFISFNGEIEFDSYTISCSEKPMKKTQLSKSLNSYEINYESYKVSPLDNYLYANHSLISKDFNSVFLFEFYKTTHNTFEYYESNSSLCLYATTEDNIQLDITEGLISKYIYTKFNK